MGRSYTLGYLFLYHARADRNTVAMLKHFEKDLTRNVIRIVAYNHKRTIANNRIEVETKKIAFDYMQLRIMLLEINN